MTSLFDPLVAGDLHLANRVIMAPLTRARASRAHVPTPRMATYYAQRAGAGLIISEATPISVQGAGWPWSPGLWNEAQVAAWQPVTAAVHAAGGRIVAQLWHMGRLVHPAMSGAQPVSASATLAPGEAHTYDGKVPHVAARALTLEEIPDVVADYAAAARNAIRAGFDGVQLHAANGYLLDQFLRDSSNHRDDAYGGTIENRARLLVEVAQAVADAIGPGRTSVRVSPNGEVNGVVDSDPAPLFAHVARELDRIGIAFLEVRDGRPDGTFGKTDQPAVSPVIRENFRGILVLNGEYDRAQAQAALDAGRADAISFGRPFIANPDLARRLRDALPLAPSGPMASWYAQGDEGYADYPAYDEQAA